VTGSIGVLGILFNAQKLLNNKLGITIDTLKTNSMADFMSFTRPVTAAEKSIMQEGIEHVYDVFISRVAAGRKMSKAEVDSIGQGRVWIGRDALRIGLVDTLGGMKEAIAIAQKLAKLDSYQLIELPKQKEAIAELIEGITDDARVKLLGDQLTEDEMRYFRQMRSLLRCRGIQARMPMDMEFY
jgi:protease-4